MTDSSKPPIPLFGLTYNQAIEALLAGHSLQLADGEILTLTDEARRALQYYAQRSLREKWETSIGKADEDEIAALIEWMRTPFSPGPFTPPATTADRPYWDVIGAEIHQFGGLHAHCKPDGKEPPPIRVRFEKPLQLLKGQNGAGKSSFIKAIAWCLTGQVPRSQEEPTEARTLTNIYTPVPRAAAAGAGMGVPEQIFLPTIVPFPGKSELDARGNAGLVGPLVATSVTLELRSAKGTSIKIRRSLGGNTKGGFPETIESIAPDGTATPITSVASTLGITEMAIEASVLNLLRLPFIRVNGENALARGVAQLTGLQPLENLGLRIEKKTTKWLDQDFPQKRRTEQDGLASTFATKIDQFRPLAESLSIDVAALPIAPNRNDEGAACQTRLDELANILSPLDADMRKKISEATGLSVSDATTDLSSLADKVSRAKFSLSADSWLALPSIKYFRLLQSLDAGQIAIINAGQIQWAEKAKEFVSIESEKAAGIRRRLFAAIGHWAKANEIAHWPPDDCPVCERKLSELADGGTALSKALKDGLDDLTALHQNLDEFEQAACDSLERELPAELRDMLRPDRAIETAREYLSQGCTNEAIEKAGLTGPFENLALRLRQMVEPFLSSLPAIPMPSPPSLPESLAKGRLAQRVQRLAEIIASAIWSHANGSAIEQMTAEVFAIGHPTDPENTFIAHLEGVEEALRAGGPLSAALLIFKEMKEIKRKWDDEMNLIRESYKVKQAVLPLQKLGEVVGTQTRAVMAELDSKTAEWRERIYDLPTRNGPALHRIGLGSGKSLEMKAVRDHIEGDGVEVTNSSQLRANLAAFALAMKAKIDAEGGGLSLLLLDDPQLLFDEKNLRRLAKGLSDFPRHNLRPIIASYDKDFLGKILANATSGEDRATSGKIECREIHPLSTGHVVRRLMRWSHVVEAVRQKWKKDDHHSARIKAYCAETRIWLEGSIAALLCVSPLPIVGTEALEALKEKLRLSRTARPYDSTKFTELLNFLDPLDPKARDGLNWSHHFAEMDLTVDHAKAVEKVIDDLFRLVRECEQILDEYSLGTAGVTAPAPTPEPAAPAPVTDIRTRSRPSTLRRFQLVGSVAAFSRTAVDDGGLPPGGTLDLDPERHGWLMTRAQWMPSLLQPGDMVIIDYDGPPIPGRPVIVFDHMPMIGWLLKRNASQVVIAGDTGHEFVRTYGPEIEVMPVLAVLFGLSAGSGPILDVPPNEAVFETIVGAVAIDAGSSAEPLLVAGDHVLVGNRMNNFDEIRSSSRPYLAARLSDETNVVKRLGKRTGPNQSILLLDDLASGQGSMAVAAPGAEPNGVPTIELAAPVLGFWFTGSRSTPS